MEKLKRPVQRILATQRCLYTFGGLPSDEAEEKEKSNYYVDGTTKKSPLTEARSKDELPNHPKPQKSSFASFRTSQLSEMDKQLKDIQIQKNKINQMIFKELRDVKLTCQDMRNGIKPMSRKDLSHLDKLSESLDMSTRQAETILRSCADPTVDDAKSVRSDGRCRDDRRTYSAVCARERDDGRRANPAENFGRQTDRRSSDDDERVESGERDASGSSGLRLSVDYEKMPYDASDRFSGRKTKSDNYCASIALPRFRGTSEMPSNLKIAATVSKDDCATENENREIFGQVQCDTPLFDKNGGLSRLYGADRAGGGRENFSVESQAGSSVSSKFLNKYPGSHTGLPSIIKSEFLRKSCSFKI